MTRSKRRWGLGILAAALLVLVGFVSSASAGIRANGRIVFLHPNRWDSDNGGIGVEPTHRTTHQQLQAARWSHESSPAKA